jgi:cell division protein FtsB
VTEPVSLSSPPAGSSTPARFFGRRIVWHTLGILLAALVAWLVFRAYRQPGFLLDFVNLQLC